MEWSDRRGPRLMIELVKQRLIPMVAAGCMAVGMLVGVGALEAQSEGTARLSGVVFDSTSMGVLAGARVAVIGTNAAGGTDASGRFVLEGIPEGSYWVSFFHDRLQELGVSPPSRQVEFTAGRTVNVELSVPSEVTLLLGWCLAEQPTPGFAAIAGIVTDSITGVPMPRAIVTAEPIGRIANSSPVEVRADDSGYFRMCSVRGGVDLRVQAHFGQSSGRSIEVYMDPGSAVLQDLVLLMSAEGTLAGYVRDYVTGDAVMGAVVGVLGTESSALTDATGRFILDDLPPGRHLVQTNHMAFEQRIDSVTIFSEETVDIEVQMATEALEVEGLVVTARTRFGRTSLAGDAKRADFLTREEIDVILPRVTATADLLRSMNTPGLRVRETYQQDEITGVMVPSICIEISRRAGGEGCRPAAVAINNSIDVSRATDHNIINRTRDIDREGFANV